MIKFFTKRMNKKGFTLVELLIVIAVLGILAAIAAPRMFGVAERFRERTDEESAKRIAREVEVKVMSGEITSDGTFTNGDFNIDMPEAQVGDGLEFSAVVDIGTTTGNVTVYRGGSSTSPIFAEEINTETN